MLRTSVLMLATVLITLSSPAQSCGDLPTTITSALRTTKDPEFVLRAAAVLQRTAIPDLKVIAKPRMPLVTVPGTAEVALAKLGEAGALASLKDELAAKDNQQAIEKLSRVGTAKAAAILLDYIAQNEPRAKSLVRDFGDYSYSPVDQAIQAVSRMMTTIPVKHYWEASEWAAWWRTQPSLQMAGPIDDGVAAPSARCYLRMADWGFPEAVLDAYSAGGGDTLPAMRTFSARGEKSLSYGEFGTVKGNAQAVLAKAGDRQQFALIAQELSTTAYQDAIKKLVYVANGRAVGALVMSLDEIESSALRSRFQEEDFRSYVRDFRSAVLSALRKVVNERGAPTCVVPDSTCVEEWKRWWSSRKSASEDN